MEERFAPAAKDLHSGCAKPLPPLVVRGLELFNAGEYFEAHELLELAWRAERAPVRELYRGILQVGVAYHHIRNGNYRGAVKTIARARRWLAPFPVRCQGIEVAAFRQSAARAEQELLRLGADGLAGWNSAWMQPVHYTQENK